MPLRNRVDPFGRLIETPARGAWFGNRGCLHDGAGRITGRTPPTEAWIVCRLAFKGRRRTLLQPGRYTELFFLDEATALAAGHRPCGECRRDDLRRFGAAWPHKARDRAFATASEIDAVLSRERRAAAGPARLLRLDPARPPCDGLFVCLGEDDPAVAYLVAGSGLWRWTPAGYEWPRPLTRRRVRLLTPPSTAGALAAGYRPQIHPSVLW